MGMRHLLVVGLSLWVGHAFAADEPHPGELLFQQHCATCHGAAGNVEARSLDTLRNMMPALVEDALVNGKMKAQAAILDQDQIKSLVAFIGDRPVEAVDWQQAMRCPDTRIDTSLPATVSSFGFGYKNHRNLTALQSGLHTADFANLELAWVLAFPNVTMMRSQPAIVGNTLFMTPVESQQVYAFDIAGSPCLKWAHTADSVLRTSLTYGHLPGVGGKAVLIFGSASASVHMIDAGTGAALWQTSLKRFPESIITGTPQLVGDRVYASASQFEIMVGANPAHECCKASGAVASLDALTGEIVWLTPTLPPAKPVRDRGDGQMIWGPSGAPVWTSPAIDLDRGLLYVGTGEANSEPAHEHTDAILALDLKTGAIVWAFQASANDIFLVGCWRNNTSGNCPPAYSINRDVDFGASVVIGKRQDGSDVLLAGQKSSTVWALDPNDKGKVLWKWNKGTGTANGGIHWGLAYDGTRVFAAISDPGRAREGFTPYPGLYALNVDDGELLWSYSTTPECEGREVAMPRCPFQYGFSAAPIVVDGAVVQGSLDGFLRAFDATTGALLFKFDTARHYDGVNGVKGHGGAIDSASLAAANGMLFVNSGYGMFGQPDGNVLLAFRPAVRPLR
jgi:polyvinyl alcohol dehydrogenase (cytochrome)